MFGVSYGSGMRLQFLVENESGVPAPKSRCLDATELLLCWSSLCNRPHPTQTMAVERPKIVMVPTIPIFSNIPSSGTGEKSDRGLLKSDSLSGSSKSSSLLLFCVVASSPDDSSLGT